MDCKSEKNIQGSSFKIIEKLLEVGLLYKLVSKAFYITLTNDHKNVTN